MVALLGSQTLGGKKVLEVGGATTPPGPPDPLVLCVPERGPVDLTVCDVILNL